MKKLTLCVSALAIFIVVACSPQATRSENTAVPAETPAPAQEPGKAFTYNFDKDPAGGLPPKFHSALTGSGAQGQWAVTADPLAPSQPNVLAQTSADKTSYRFPLAIADEGSFRDQDLSVRFKTISGRVDQAAGLSGVSKTQIIITSFALTRSKETSSSTRCRAASEPICPSKAKDVRTVRKRVYLPGSGMNYVSLR